jgi:hypothetical protein
MLSSRHLQMLCQATFRLTGEYFSPSALDT